MARKKFGNLGTNITKSVDVEDTINNNLNNMSFSEDKDPLDQSQPEPTKVQELVQKIENKSEKNTAFNFKMIRREKLRFHEENDYPMENIEKLAESILDVGLIHNIEVYYDEDQDHYIIDSGEQRTRAIDLLISKYSKFEDKNSNEYKKYLHYVKPLENGYPCNVRVILKETDISENDYLILEKIQSEMRLIIANEIGRAKDIVRTQSHVEKLDKLYSRQNELLKKTEKINVDNKIAEDLNLTDRQVRKYKNVNKLIPDLQKLFQENKINLTESANYAKLNEEEQQQILNLIETGADKTELKTALKNLEIVREELKEKDKKIEELTEKNLVSLQAIENKENEMKSIREEIEHELKKDAPDPELVKHLEEKNKNYLLEIEKYKKNIQLVANEKEAIIFDLKKKLEKKNDISEHDKKIMKLQFTLNEMTESLSRSVSKVLNSMTEYNILCNEQNTPEMIEEYKNKLLKLANDINSSFE